MAQNEYVLTVRIDPLSELEAIEMLPYLDDAVTCGLLSNEEASTILTETLVRNLVVE